MGIMWSNPVFSRRPRMGPLPLLLWSRLLWVGVFYKTLAQDLGEARHVETSDTPMACHGPRHDTPSRALACLTALQRHDKGPQGHNSRHGSDKACGEAMHNNSRGVEEHNEDATIRQLIVAAQLKVHEELIQDGS